MPDIPSEELRNPKFELVESHFSHPVPQSLRRLYADHDELARTDFTVITGSRVLANVANFWWSLVEHGQRDKRIRTQWFVESYSPINEDSLESFEGFERFLEFADDGSEGLYVIDPTEQDPQVYLFMMDSHELIPVGCRLSRFLRARRLDGEPEEDDY